MILLTLKSNDGIIYQLDTNGGWTKIKMSGFSIPKGIMGGILNDNMNIMNGVVNYNELYRLNSSLLDFNQFIELNEKEFRVWLGSQYETLSEGVARLKIYNSLFDRDNIKTEFQLIFISRNSI